MSPGVAHRIRLACKDEYLQGFRSIGFRRNQENSHSHRDQEMMFQIVGFHQRGFFALIGGKLTDGKLIGVCKSEFIIRNDAGYVAIEALPVRWIVPSEFVCCQRTRQDERFAVCFDLVFSGSQSVAAHQIDRPMGRNALKKVE